VVERRPGTREPAMAVKESRADLSSPSNGADEWNAAPPRISKLRKLDFYGAPTSYPRDLQPARRRGHDPMRALLPRYDAALDTYSAAHS